MGNANSRHLDDRTKYLLITTFTPNPTIMTAKGFQKGHKPVNGWYSNMLKARKQVEGW